MMFPYEDIVNLEHYKNPSRRQMTAIERAAQFMPFKALNEYEDVIAKKDNELDVAEDPNYVILYE